MSFGLGTPYKACGGNAGSGSATLAVTVTTSTAAGDVIAVWVTTNSGTVSNVTDSASNTYTAQPAAATGGGLTGQWWVSPNSSPLTSGSSTITVTLSVSSSSKTLTAFGCSGVEAAGWDQSPTPTNGTSTSPSVTTSALTWHRELCLAGLANGNAGGTVTWGGNFASPAVSDSQHNGSNQWGQAAAVRVSIAWPSSTTVTASGTITSTAWCASVLTLKAATRILGATVVPSGMGLTDELQASNLFDADAGRPYAVTAQKEYFNTTALKWPAAVGTDISELATQGCVFLFSFKPDQSTTGTYGSSSQATVHGSTIGAELANLASAIALFKNAGIGFRVCLWQECNGHNSFPSATAYHNYVRYYGTAVRNAGIVLVYDPTLAAPADNTNAASVIAYWPGDAWVDEFVVDYYALDSYGQGNTTPNTPLSSVVQLADNRSPQPVPFGLGEWGNSATPGTADAATWNNYTNYLISFFAARKSAGKAYWLTYYSGSGTQNPLAGPGDYKVPQMQALWDALAPGAATGQAQLTATATLSANGTTTGTTKFGGAQITATAKLAATGTDVSVASAAITATVTLTTSGGAAGFIVQQVSGFTTFDYGISSVEMTTTPGNTLVVLAGWDLSASPVTGLMPAIAVTDSAANNWVHVATTPATVSGSRSSAWICPGAAGIAWLSVSLTGFASSLAYTVLELAGMPSLYELDVWAADGNGSAKSLSLKPGATTDAGFAFAVLATGALTAVPAAPAGWTALPAPTSAGTSSGPATIGGGAIVPPAATGAAQVPGTANPVAVYPYVQVPTAGTSLATTWNLAQAVPVSGVVFSVSAAPPQPFQPNPNFPVLKVEAGFGWTPGDPSQAPPNWVDITSRCIGKDGDFFIEAVAGRQYELAAPEAGSLTVAADNHDGAFTPGGPAAYAGLALEVPIRVSAYWAGIWYPVGYGFLERVPQEWPDLPQWGLSKMVATDAISVMAAVTMASAMDSDALIDAPYVLLPLAEQYLSFSNGLSAQGILGFFSVSDAQGLLAQNASRVNQRAGVYVDGVGSVPGGTASAIAQTGQTTSLLGTSNTGFGTSSIGTGTAPSNPLSGPGVIYTDPSLPGPTSPNGVTVSFWVIIPTVVTVASVQPTVFTAYGPPTNYPGAHASLSVQIMNLSGGNTLKVTLADGSTVSAPFNVSATAQRITLCVTASSLSIYVNGALGTTVGLTAAQTTAWYAVSLGNPNYAYGSAGTVAGNFTAFGLAIHACQVPVQRIVSQYNTGISGQQNCDALVRVAQILSWAGLGLARAGRITFSGQTCGVLQGPAYNLAGATAAAAVAQVAANESGMVCATPTGAVEFIHKWGLLNAHPVVVFGDSSNAGAGEIPYDPKQSWGFDNAYLASVWSTSQQYGANTLFTQTGADFTSQRSYGPRSGPVQTITTMSAQDAADSVNWSLAKYSQPSLRVAGITIDAAANPSAAFPAVLALQQGQVATVIRRPVGAPPIQQNCLIQKITHSIGAGRWQVQLQLSPYSIEANVLQLDTAGFDVVGNNALA